MDRVMGWIRGAEPGPTLLCIGGVHGNEPAGVQALGTVLAALALRAASMRGDFVALVGNRSALSLGRRFVDRDLNRAWTDERMAKFRVDGQPTECVEDREQVDLLDAIEDVVENARGPVYLLDLHTTSGSGGPFTTFGDTLPNRALASHIPVPMVLGLEELLDGTLLAFLGRHGIVGTAYESGQHEEPRAVDRAEAGAWLIMAAAGLLPERLIPEAAAGRRLLESDAGHLPRAMEMFYRHHIEPPDGFVMDPGYQNFQPVKRGQAVARDVRGPVCVERDARMLMPLYQKQGEDGFFLMREFSPFWLRASSVLRRLGVDRMVHLLPGLSLDPEMPDAVVVDRLVARWYAPQLLHLLGFRKHEESGARLVMRRRRFDDVRYVVGGPRPERLR
ncbi:MAG: succinylglutamate desuccinylase/aspartoacylase family protein [Longimicrobiales bacterium]|nr:succinylglutamate desuccinylase/aspartoacylase family protein [Longimicrobiales bacterium]